MNVVGIISADSLLNYPPDFRSHERGFQLMMQAAGRAGRKNKQGLVIIQSAHPGQPIYRYLLNNDYESFFRSQLTERKLFNYPPYSRIICIIFKHRNEKIVEKASAFFYQLFETIFAGACSRPQQTNSKPDPNVPYTRNSS